MKLYCKSTSHKQVDIEILVSSTESNHFSGPCRRRRYLIRVDGLRKKYGKWIDQSSKQRHLPPEHIYIESDESNDTKNQNQNQNDGDVVNCEVAASKGGLKKPTLVANQKGEVDHHGKHENVNGNKGKSSSCIVLSDSDFETPEQLREKKTNVSGKRKRITKSASTSSHKKKRTETTSVGKRKFFHKDWSTGKVKDGVKGSILRKKICSCLRKTRDTCKRKKIEKAAKAAKAKPNTEDRKQILVRTSPNTFANTVRALSDEQKQWVVDVGFGSILSFSLTKFPLKLAYNVVWSYNMDDFEMDLLAGKIPITEDDVHEVLGLPQGPRRIQIVKNEDAEKSWSLHDPSEYWLVNPKTRHYYGPLLFLIYFYLDRVHNQRWNVIRKVPTFSGWTTLMIQQRQNYEEINKSFGRGKILGRAVQISATHTLDMN
ncbi:hypothetical protein POM88_016585 [Heracleum sosnowskyi]|uniref:Uncharacterized protein n=1 Tax=Heracleum sosnowskyi TaxID=360622 RepID=A0AAD8IQ34_9APIA|nr:hypothetical protein POM88_016585 [Heracleum sosnowskyi]